MTKQMTEKTNPVADIDTRGAEAWPVSPHAVNLTIQVGFRVGHARMDGLNAIGVV